MTQTSLVNAGLEVVDSFVSITELSEYASRRRHEEHAALSGVAATRKVGLVLLPDDKRRNENQNWYRLTFDERKELMYEHGTSGRKFAGRIVQLITASTGLDD